MLHHRNQSTGSDKWTNDIVSNDFRWSICCKGLRKPCRLFQSPPHPQQNNHPGRTTRMSLRQLSTCCSCTGCKRLRWCTSYNFQGMLDMCFQQCQRGYCSSHPDTQTHILRLESNTMSLCTQCKRLHWCSSGTASDNVRNCAPHLCRPHGSDQRDTLIGTARLEDKIGPCKRCTALVPGTFDMWMGKIRRFLQALVCRAFPKIHLGMFPDTVMTQ